MDECDQNSGENRMNPFFEPRHHLVALNIIALSKRKCIISFFMKRLLSIYFCV